MATVHLGLGSNLGDRRENIRAALAALARLPGTGLPRAAGLYETDPVGGPAGQGTFLNTACAVDTTLAPREMLEAIQGIEIRLGRDRGPAAVRWGPRTIDIDILLWGDTVVDEDPPGRPSLVIPHPRLAERAFALLPLAELAPDAIHPVAGETIQELLERIGPPDAGIRRLSL